MENQPFENKLDRGYSLNNTYSELFWKFPQFLIKNEKYKKMKDSSKIAYMLFKDRISFAIHKNWIDKNNILYLIFEQKDLMNLLNCYQGKVKSTLDELVRFGLLEIERGGFDTKTKKNAPNKYYLLQPELTESDLYLITKNAEIFDNSGYAEIAHREQNSEILDNSGYAEIAHREQNAEILDNSGYAEIALSKDISINQDTKKEDTKKEDTKKEDTKNQQISNSFDETVQLDKNKLQEQELLNHFAETHQEYSFLNYENLSLIQLFSDSLLDAENMIGIILRAKKTTEKKFNQVLIADETYKHDELLDIQGNIAKTLRRIYQKRKTDSKIESIDNYMFGSFTALFTKLLNELNEYKNECKI